MTKVLPVLSKIQQSPQVYVNHNSTKEEVARMRDQTWLGQNNKTMFIEQSLQQAHDQNWWMVVFAWTTAACGAMFSVVRMSRFAIAKIKRLFDLPDQIDAMGKAALIEAQRVTANLSDKIELLDGRFKIGQTLVGSYAFLELDENGLATFVSATAIAALGRTQEDCLVNGWWSAIEANTSSEKMFLRDHWAEAKRTGERLEFDVIVSNEWTRKRVPYRLRIVPIHRAAGGKLLGWKVLLSQPPTGTGEVTL